MNKLKSGKALFALAVGAISIVPAFAVRVPFEAQIRGGGGNGKCTIEVEVDNVATIEISGTRGILNSPNGNSANWRRFQCNQPFPRNPANFRFSGIDGRGSQRLLRDPNNNGGTAVIQITDNQGGREGYTFDIEWNGGGYQGGNQGGGDGGYYPPSGGGRPGWGGGQNFPVERAIEVCKDEVRNRARQDYRVRNLEFTGASIDDNRGRNDWIVGSFRSGRRDRYSFACSVNFDNGRVRDVEIRRR